MKKTIFRLSVMLLAAALAAGCNNAAKKAEEAAAAEQARLDSIAAVEKAQKEKIAMEKMTTLPEEPVFNIETNLGTIKIRLYSKTPKHRDNFEKLALTGFYDSLLFHRVINGFMIQGGDPYTRDTSAAAVAKYGQGGPGYIYIIEFKLNGSAEAALRQIEDKGYAKPYAADNRKLIAIGINFSSEKGTIDGFLPKEILHGK